MPSLGHWNAILTHLNEWLIADGGNLGRRIACFFKEPKGRSPKLQSTALARGCNDFVKYRNDTLGHGVTLQDAACRAGLGAWMPLIQELLGAVATLHDWRLAFVDDCECCQIWMGPEPPIEANRANSVTCKSAISFFVVPLRKKRMGPNPTFATCTRSSVACATTAAASVVLLRLDPLSRDS